MRCVHILGAALMAFSPAFGQEKKPDTDTLPGACYAGGHDELSVLARDSHLRLPTLCRAAARAHSRASAGRLADEQGVEIEHIAKAPHPQGRRGGQGAGARAAITPGLVHVISAMEACESYQPWHDKASGKTFLRPDTGKCLHYYFYFIDEELGLCYLRVPTWCPFRLQFYCNGHSWLAPTAQRATASTSPRPTTPSCASPTSRARRRWPIRSSPTSCTAGWTATPALAARCSTSSGRPTTGASCRWSTPPT